jgi:hypothetical protein
MDLATHGVRSAPIHSAENAEWMGDPSHFIFEPGYYGKGCITTSMSR